MQLCFGEMRQQYKTLRFAGFGGVHFLRCLKPNYTPIRCFQPLPVSEFNLFIGCARVRLRKQLAQIVLGCVVRQIAHILLGFHNSSFGKPNERSMRSHIFLLLRLACQLIQKKSARISKIGQTELPDLLDKYPIAIPCYGTVGK